MGWCELLSSEEQRAAATACAGGLLQTLLQLEVKRALVLVRSGQDE